VLSADLPEVIERYLQADVTEFLATHDLGLDDIGVYVSHPGGPKIIEAIVSSLGLPDDALELTWRSLAEIGNISSASVLHVLRDTMAKQAQRPRADDGDGAGVLLRVAVAQLALTQPWVGICS
jgi:alkylresorcinol/alkylpyrone synthase